jgi:cyclic pyranopterin phosphate synthase
MAKTPSAALTHLTADGSAHMVDVSHKASTARVAVADGQVRMSRAAYDAMVTGQARKGDVLGAARIAGIMGAKKTSELIPLCHPLALSSVTVDLEPDAALPGVNLRATVKTLGNTGVEMEALTAVTCAALCVYDMLKAVDRGMEMGGFSLSLKDGGKSGRYERAPRAKRGRA